MLKLKHTVLYNREGLYRHEHLYTPSSAQVQNTLNLQVKYTHTHTEPMVVRTLRSMPSK